LETLFPFGFPGPTALYLSLYVITLGAHVVFMNYVLAGSAVLAVHSLSRRGPSLLTEILRDWLSFALSAAITAGIAPLLFVQILYKQGFYTANLLLFHRWMLIVPALIAGFYLLYALKSDVLTGKPWRRALAATLAFACFGFTALSWTENYLLARDSKVWADLYAQKLMAYRNPEIVPRLLLWSAGAFPTLSSLLGWQVLRKEREGIDVPDAAWRMLAWMALGGLVASAVFVGIYAVVMGPEGRGPMSGPMALPYAILVVSAVAIQALAWTCQILLPSRRGRWLGIATVGLGCTIVGMTSIREVLRVTAVSFPALYPQHARAADTGGFWLFVAFLVINAALATWAIRTTLRKARPIGASGKGGSLPPAETSPESTSPPTLG
jgi:hypothetical protein